MRMARTETGRKTSEMSSLRPKACTNRIEVAPATARRGWHPRGPFFFSQGGRAGSPCTDIDGLAGGMPMRAPNTETSTAAVGVSVSESPDLWALGLSDGHLRDAMAEIALHVLGSGRSLAYGEDLRQHGFMEFLAELTGRYRNHPRHGGTIVVTDYLAWPVHIRMTSDELAAFSAEHEPAARLVFLALDGACLAPEQRMKMHVHEPDDAEWTEGLTAMRTVMRGDIGAWIVLGGRVEGYRGRCPGSPRRHASLSKQISLSSCSAGSAGARATLRRRSVSPSVGPARAMDGPGGIASASTHRTISTTGYPATRTPSWPTRPISRRQSPSSHGVCVGFSAMGAPRSIPEPAWRGTPRGRSAPAQ